jgi:hypothetical protein
LLYTNCFIFDATILGYELVVIADIFGITKGALKWRKFAMIETLKQALERVAGALMDRVEKDR